MNIEKVFSIPESESTVRQRISSYFEQAGYRTELPEGTALIFKRGSRKGSWFSLSPSSQLTTAEVNLMQKGDYIGVKASFDIKAVVRDESHFTDEFWAGEIKDLEKALFKGEYTSLKDKKLTRRALWANFKSLGPSVVFIVIWGVISFGLTFLVFRLPGGENVEPLAVALGGMIAGGIITYIIAKFWNRRRKAKAGNRISDR